VRYSFSHQDKRLGLNTHPRYVFGGAFSHDLWTLTMDAVAGWRNLLLARIDEFAKCTWSRSWSDVFVDVLEGVPVAARHGLRKSRVNARKEMPSAAKALGVWRRMLREVRHAPLFPSSDLENW